MDVSGDFLFIPCTDLLFLPHQEAVCLSELACGVWMGEVSAFLPSVPTSKILSILPGLYSLPHGGCEM